MSNNQFVVIRCLNKVLIEVTSDQEFFERETYGGIIMTLVKKDDPLVDRISLYVDRHWLLHVR